MNAPITPEPVWRIAKWSETFERAESRKLKTLTWIAMPVGFTSTGYQALLEEFSDEGDGMLAAAIYGGWAALCAFAAGCHVRGVLGDSRGRPLKLSHIARVTGLPVNVLARVFAWASQPQVGWLEPVSHVEFQSELTKTQENQRPATPSGESPDSSGGIPQAQDRTGPDRTGPDQTEKDISRRSIDWGGRWSAANFEFRERVRDAAMRLSRVRSQSLDRDLIWQACWVGTEFDRQTLDDCITRIGSGEILKPKAYLGKSMVTLCSKAGEDWDTLRRLVPPTPPPSPSAVRIEPDAMAGGAA